MLAIELLILKGAMASGIALSLDMLATANRLLLAGGKESLFALGLTGNGAAPWRKLVPQPLPPATGDPRIIIIPGLSLMTEQAVLQGLQQKPVRDVITRLQAAAAAGAEVHASCSATFLPAAAGLLAGKRATTTWWLAPLFHRLYPDVALDPDHMLIRDGRITTAGAALAHGDLMQALIARHGGAALAGQVARYLLLDARRSQLPYSAVSLLAAGDRVIAGAEVWARERLGRGIGVEDLASAAGLSPRTFARRLEKVTGLTPVRFLQRLRVEKAVELLAVGRLPLETIAARVGYAEASTLRRLLKGQGALRPRPS